MILEAYYEPAVFDRSHGFRPRGEHRPERLVDLDRELVRRGRHQRVFGSVDHDVRGARTLY